MMGRRDLRRKDTSYFGRAIDFTGVYMCELFQSKKTDERMKTKLLHSTNQGPAFCDLEKADGRHERQAGKEYEYTNVREILNLPLDDPIPKMSRGSSASSSPLPKTGLLHFNLQMATSVSALALIRLRSTLVEFWAPNSTGTAAQLTSVPQNTTTS
ncbi:hypothetical protein DFH29DRAFT_1083538 [Suillus ampliporus]|nr:hypothetical protein DFH29DRAFT_1083538 [Suillus ampliporus]